MGTPTLMFELMLFLATDGARPFGGSRGARP
jgi:hypothetical protein